jgi:electron transport complex protein RnfB
MQVVFYAVLVMAALGALLGGLLAFSGKVFATKEDPRIEQVRDCLPGANCGACGYAGCDQYAAAIINQGVTISACPVGGSEVVEAIAQLLGVATEERDRYVAQVRCQGGRSVAKPRGVYTGAKDCRAAKLIGGTKLCEYGCMGLGNCVRVCPFDAIVITDDGIADVLADKCKACGRCVEACPQHIISMIPENQPVRIGCQAMERGKAVRDVCQVGCIGCGLCQKTCAYDAITITDYIPTIDYSKCVACGQCAEKCPTKAIIIES